jgi:hypothetical protein
LLPCRDMHSVPPCATQNIRSVQTHPTVTAQHIPIDLNWTIGRRNLPSIFSPLIPYMYHISSVESVISHRNHCRHVLASHSGCHIEVHVQVCGTNRLIRGRRSPKNVAVSLKMTHTPTVSTRKRQRLQDQRDRKADMC